MIITWEKVEGGSPTCDKPMVNIRSSMLLPLVGVITCWTQRPARMVETKLVKYWGDDMVSQQILGASKSPAMSVDEEGNSLMPDWQCKKCNAQFIEE